KWTWEGIMKLSGAFEQPRILLTAAELDLFTKLDGKPQTAEELSRKEGWSARGLTILLDALTAMGLLFKSDDGRYRVEESALNLLADGYEDSIRPMLLHRVHIWNSWSGLTEMVRTGSIHDAKYAGERSDDEVEAFIGAMHVVARRMAEAIADSIDLKSFHRMLDVGGGPGTYIMAFLRKAPQMKATLFDLPRVAAMAKKRLSQNGFIDRVKIVEGDYTKDVLPEGHDLTLLSAIIHQNSREGNRELYKKIYRSLDPGGAIFIRDYFLDASRTAPLRGAMFAVNMLVATRGGNCYTVDEVKEDLAAAGFRDIRMIQDGDRMNQLISGVK
ncbi:MAG: methyltransferase, partial [Deltaproteobacteria bacterium]